VVKGIDLLRRRTRERGRLELDASPDTLASESANPAELGGLSEQIEQLRAALAEMPEQQAEALALRHLSDMGYDEIAREMGMTVNAVGVLLNRARANLAERMGAASERKGEP
jgi:RNA polymerase sigma-70 factor (ECF subfamily)